MKYYIGFDYQFQEYEIISTRILSGHETPQLAIANEISSEMKRACECLQEIPRSTTAKRKLGIISNINEGYKNCQELLELYKNLAPADL